MKKSNARLEYKKTQLLDILNAAYKFFQKYCWERNIKSSYLASHSLRIFL